MIHSHTDTLRATPAQAMTPRAEVGELLRKWRQRRKLSQLALALDVGVSARHLCFVETGRARPSARLLLAISEHLALPLRQRNKLLLAAGHAPRFRETALQAPDLSVVHAGLQRLLDAHHPYPGVVLDGRFNVVSANAAAGRLVALLPPEHAAPVNLFRASLHPRGLAAVTANFSDWARHLLRELDALCSATEDAEIVALADEVAAYPNVVALRAQPEPPPDPDHAVLLPLVLDLGGQRLSLFTTRAHLGTPRDVTLDELSVELFYPADAETEALLRSERWAG